MALIPIANAIRRVKARQGSSRIPESVFVARSGTRYSARDAWDLCMSDIGKYKRVSIFLTNFNALLRYAANFTGRGDEGESMTEKQC